MGIGDWVPRCPRSVPPFTRTSLISVTLGELAADDVLPVAVEALEHRRHHRLLGVVAYRAPRVQQDVVSDRLEDVHLLCLGVGAGLGEAATLALAALHDGLLAVVPEDDRGRAVDDDAGHLGAQRLDLGRFSRHDERGAVQECQGGLAVGQPRRDHLRVLPIESVEVHDLHAICHHASLQSV